MSALRGLVALVAGVLGGRAEPRRQATTASGAGRGRRANRPDERAPQPAGGTPAADRIRALVAEWRGVPYQMGGTDRRGVDCSGFVRHLFRELFGCALPRTSEDQARQGAEVDANELRPGDLVFFEISERTRHVGVYVGDGEFGHASTSRGPMVSKLASDYWRQRYWTARRIL